MIVANDNPQSIKVTCLLRVVDANTSTMQSFSNTQTVIPDDAVDFLWELENKAIIVPSIACKLPPNGVIGGIIAGYKAF